MYTSNFQFLELCARQNYYWQRTYHTMWGMNLSNCRVQATKTGGSAQEFAWPTFIRNLSPNGTSHSKSSKTSRKLWQKTARKWIWMHALLYLPTDNIQLWIQVSTAKVPHQRQCESAWLPYCSSPKLIMETWNPGDFHRLSALGIFPMALGLRKNKLAQISMSGRLVWVDTWIIPFARTEMLAS